MDIELLFCIGRAAFRQALKAIMKCIPLGAAVFDVAKEAHEEWTRGCDARKRRQEVEALAQLSASQARDQAQRTAASVTQDPDEREALAGYLNQMPAQARRTLSRPEDLSGHTVQAAQSFQYVNDLVPFVPLRRSALRPGQTIRHAKSAWVLLDALGAGGFGEVWRAQSLEPTGDEVALKFCLAQNADALASLRNEVEMLGRLRGHWGGIVPLQMDCLDAAQPFLVYDYIPGGDLVRLISAWHHRPPQKGLIHEAVRLVRHLARTLQPAHDLAETVVHRDLKPSNILLKPGTKERHYVPLLCDFGIGSVSSTLAIGHSRSASVKETTTQCLRGAHSLLYASPQRRRFYDNPKDEPLPIPADDVYALGVIGYQILLGDTSAEPLSGAKSRLAAQNVPPAVIAVLRKSFATEVEDRLPNAGALVAALEEAMPEVAAQA